MKNILMEIQIFFHKSNNLLLIKKKVYSSLKKKCIRCLHILGQYFTKSNVA